ncbi:uncharacterized protein LOC131303289 isoform X2 [Rhododendron vialii]|uniref:uncharacterized protein LOC131303289 isoform X2 n=1 Tax=Rhododendron vialii TaxID=182163 RepID=UPI0026604F6A|nr:uncharacterized protein LOC131303289 isoform X2 [Rhododendron vialii]
MGTMSGPSPGILPEKLTEDNYEYWKVCVRRYLIGLGLWDVVSGTKAQPPKDADDYEDWERKNALALVVIQQSYGKQKPNAVGQKISANGDTALHVAILAGHIQIAEELVKSMSAEELEMTNKYGDTALSLAAISGVTKLAKLIVPKNPKLVTRRTDQSADGHVPIIVASLYGHKEMVHYLYRETHNIGELSSEDGATLLNCLITADMYDVASHLLEQNPQLGLTKDHYGNYTLRILAKKPSAFPSGCKLVYWKRWIYSSISVNSLQRVLKHGGGPFHGPTDEENPTRPRHELNARGNIIDKGMLIFSPALCVRACMFLYLVPFVHVKMHVSFKVMQAR